MMIKQVTDFVDRGTGEVLYSKETYFTLEYVADKEISKMVKYHLTKTFKEVNDHIDVFSTRYYTDGTTSQVTLRY